jgi:hypothetical protein
MEMPEDITISAARCGKPVNIHMVIRKLVHCIRPDHMDFVA